VGGQPVQWRRLVALDSDLGDRGFEESLFLLRCPTFNCPGESVVSVSQARVVDRRIDFLGTAARQRLLPIASAFDLSGAPSGNWSTSPSLVRRRPAVRVRPWAPNSIGPFPSIFWVSCSPQKCGKEMLFHKWLVPQFGVIMRSSRDWVRLDEVRPLESPAHSRITISGGTHGSCVASSGVNPKAL